MMGGRFILGEAVRHKLLGYRGVIAGVDARFEAEGWYEAASGTRPPEGELWYRVRVEGTYEAYVAHAHLEADARRDYRYGALRVQI